MDDLTPGKGRPMRFRKGAVLGVSALALGAAAVAGGETGLDAGFGVSGGLVMTPLEPSSVDRYYGVAPAPDGGTYNVGVLTTAAAPGDQRFALTHVDPNGRLDGKFGTNGVASINVF